MMGLRPNRKRYVVNFNSLFLHFKLKREDLKKVKYWDNRILLVSTDFLLPKSAEMYFLLDIG